MEDFGIFYGRLVYFVAVRYILWPFGIFCGRLVYFMVIWYIFFTFWYVVTRKIWQPCLSALSISQLFFSLAICCSLPELENSK
jgi:hypothetical protein